jgi:transposase
LPPDYGCWSNPHPLFIRWRDNGIWEKLLERLVDNPDFQ